MWVDTFPMAGLLSTCAVLLDTASNAEEVARGGVL